MPPSTSEDRTTELAKTHPGPAPMIGGDRFPPGTVLSGRFRIITALGSGGMGEVYRAEDLKLRQNVALKFLPAAATSDAARLRRLFEEVRIAREISHPNVCRVHDVVETRGLHFISMEYVDGEDLASLLRRIGRPPRAKATALGVEICAGLEAIHERGLLHQDLKPANLMIDGRGRARIADFGLAGAAGGRGRGGTPGYMAPEQQAGGTLSVETDLYALGLVLWELFTGQRPKPPESLPEGLDPALEAVLRRCLAEHPDARPSSVREVAAILSAAPASRPGSLPSRTGLWYVPFERNPFFTGRDELLERLRETLERDGTAAIAGLGGIGKTQTAVEYTYRYRERYDAVLWTPAETVDDLETGFVAIARRLDLAEKDAALRQVTVRAVREWLETNASWLLVLDNADTPSDLKGRLPARHTGHVLLTSRARAFGRLARPLEITTLSPAAAEMFLLRRVHRDTTSHSEGRAVAELARELGYLPLALEQAGAYIEETGAAFQTYLDGFRHRRLKLLGEETAPDEHLPVTATWEMNFAEIEAASEASADLLRVSAFLAPDAIPVELVVEAAVELGPTLAAELDEARGDALIVDELLAPLRRYSLVQRDAAARTFSLHRLVQEAVRARMDEDTRKLWAQRVVHAVVRALPAARALLRFHDLEILRRAERLDSHGRAARQLVKRWTLRSSAVPPLLNRLGSYAFQRGVVGEAESLFREALATARRQTDQPRDTIVSWLGLAIALEHQGAYAEAESAIRESLTLSRSHLGSEHEGALSAQVGLARVILSKGGLGEAEQLLREAPALRSRGSVSDRAHGLYLQGLILFIKGVSLDEAERLCGQCAEMSRLGEVPAWPFYESFRAFLLSWRGAHEEAEALGREALTTVQRLGHELLGGRDLDFGYGIVAATLSNLALVLAYKGSYEEAERRCREALAIQRRQLGDKHPIVGRSLFYLAVVLVLQGPHEEAEELFAEALSIRRHQLGDEHYDVAFSLSGLATLRLAQRRWTEAEELILQALQIRRRNLPAGSFWIAGDEIQLAAARTGRQRYEEAEPLLVRGHAVLKDQLGERSPLTLSALDGLVTLYEAWGKKEKAAEHRAPREAAERS